MTLAACALLASLLVTAAAAGSEVPRGAIVYADRLEDIRHSSKPAPIESLYELGMAVADTLALSVASMDESTLERTRRLLAGFEVVPDGVYEGAIPDPAFFAGLAREHGDAADTAFFRSVSATTVSGVLPIYVEQQTDYSGCTRFGTGSLVETYGTWRTFRRNHPHRYVERASRELEAVTDELLTADCACGDRASVAGELRAFLSRYAGDAAGKRVRARLKEIESGKGKVRERCVSG